MNKKIKLLARINKKLAKPKEWPGVFLPLESKQRDDVMFLAEMPSLNEPKKNQAYVNFNTTARDRFFCEMISKYKVAGVYVTDIVKRRNNPGRPTRKDIEIWRSHLLNEIKILQPKLIIVIGKINYYKNYLPYINDHVDKNIVVDYIYHYCSQVSRKKFENRFKQIINKHNVLLTHDVHTQERMIP